MFITTFDWILIAFIVCLGIISIFLVRKEDKKLAKFYQIWAKDEFLTENFIVMSGFSNKKRLITHNHTVFYKDDYIYLHLPFANQQMTNKDIYDMSEQEYLAWCSGITQKMSKKEDDK